MQSLNIPRPSRRPTKGEKFCFKLLPMTLTVILVVDANRDTFFFPATRFYLVNDQYVSAIYVLGVLKANATVRRRF